MIKSNAERVLRMLRATMTNEEEIFNEIIRHHSSKLPFKLTYLAFHTLSKLEKQPDMLKLYESNFHLMADGIGIILLLERILRQKIRLFAGTNIYIKVLRRIFDTKSPVALIGGSDEVHRLIEQAQYTNIVYHCHGLFNDSYSAEILKGIKDADIVFIGMGSPKQEYWALRFSEEYPEKIYLCVGNLFEFYFGTKKRAGIFFQKFGIEWVHRLFTEPARLWKRYLIGIPVFIFKAIGYIRLNSKYYS